MKGAKAMLKRGKTERFRRIYDEMRMLFADIQASEIFDYRVALPFKMASFEIMHWEALKKAKHLETTAKKERAEEKVLLDKTTTSLYSAAASFEAYLNSFYSLLQIIAKFTPYFYGADKYRIPARYFGEQVNFFITNPDFDPEFSYYLAHRLRWYETLKNNRHAVTHRISAFLGFEKDEVVFQDYPAEKSDLFGEKKFRDIRAYLVQSFDEFFDFIEFYVQHFRNRIPESETTRFLRKALDQNKHSQIKRRRASRSRA